ncbi:GNAT family N-acetyltransferase [Kribbella sp. CA-253562]|uniref:GNAT family N-acetyltransferase n=1 Tax=Kribbella sp. CA-253562 TaxID=3239942 RepID=UPI003D910F1A
MLLVRRAGPVAVSDPPVGVALRSPTTDDIEALGRTYFASYPPGVACATEVEAIDDIRLTYAGEYGVLDLARSRIAVHGDEIVGAVLVVEHGPWEDVPDCPFVIEVFTLPAWRRRGLARSMVTTCLAVEPTDVALRVQDGNHAALGLYGHLGFAQV